MKSVTLGVLICDSVKPELQSIAGDYPEMFEHLCRDYPAQGYDVTLRHYDVRAGEFPENLSECDGYVTSGSAASVNDDEPWIDTLAEFVRHLNDQNAKLFAICFGHQMMAKALGGRVEIAEQGWGVGVHDATIDYVQPWMNPTATSFRLISSHKEQITELPQGAEIIASSPHCPTAMIRCGNLIGVQGHPEFFAPYAQALMDSRASIIPAETRSAASESFDDSNADHALLTSWIVNYVVRKSISPEDSPR